MSSSLSNFKHLVPLFFKIKSAFLSRFSKGKRSNLHGSSVKSLHFIAEEETAPKASISDVNTDAQPKRTTRKNKQRKSEVAEDVCRSPRGSCETEEVGNGKPELVEGQESDKEVKLDYICNTAQSPPKVPSPEVVASISPAEQPLPKIPSPEVVVSISSEDRLSAEHAKMPEPSPGRTATKITIAGAPQSSGRRSVRCSLKLRHSMAGLRHSMTQESVRRASRRSMLKRKVARMVNSTCSKNSDGENDTYLIYN